MWQKSKNINTMLQTLLLLLSSLVAYDHGAITETDIRQIQELRADLIAQNLVTPDELSQVDALIVQIETENRIVIITSN
jgi:hypothetical protein